MMSSDTAKNILDFLFVYYHSYHEAFAQSGENIPLRTFSAWFHTLRKKAHKKMTKERKQREKAAKLLTGRRLEEHNRRLMQKLKAWKEKWQDDGFDGAYDLLKKMVHVVRYTEEELATERWWQVFKVSERSLSCDESLDAVRHDVLKKYRLWSRFVHPDRSQNQNHGILVQDLLASRFVLLNDSKQEMLEWYEKAKKCADKRKRKRTAKGYKKGGRRVFQESDSENEVIEIL